MQNPLLGHEARIAQLNGRLEKTMNPKTTDGNIAADAAEKMAATGRKTVEKVMKIGAETAADAGAKTAAFGRERLDAAKDAYDMTAVSGKANMEAVSEAAAAVASGWQAWSEGLVDYATTAMEDNAELTRRFLDARTPADFLDLQVESVSRSTDRVLAQSAKMTRIASDTAEQAFKPIKARLDSAVAAPAA